MDIFTESVLKYLLSIYDKDKTNLLKGGQEERDYIASFIENHVPHLMAMSLVLCKHKQPIYNIMQVSTDRIGELVGKIKEKQSDNSESTFGENGKERGIFISFADIRGSFTNRSMSRVMGLSDFIKYLKMAKEIPKRLLTETENFASHYNKLKDARNAYALVRGNRVMGKNKNRALEEFAKLGIRKDNSARLDGLATFLKKGER